MKNLTLSDYIQELQDAEETPDGVRITFVDPEDIDEEILREKYRLERERDKLKLQIDLLRNKKKGSKSYIRPLCVSEERFVQIMNSPQLHEIIDRKSRENAHLIYQNIQTNSDNLEPRPKYRINFIDKPKSGLWSKCQLLFKCAVTTGIIDEKIYFADFFSRYCLFKGKQKNKKAVWDGCRNYKKHYHDFKLESIYLDALKYP